MLGNREWLNNHFAFFKTIFKKPAEVGRMLRHAVRESRATTSRALGHEERPLPPGRKPWYWLPLLYWFFFNLWIHYSEKLQVWYRKSSGTYIVVLNVYFHIFHIFYNVDMLLRSAYGIKYTHTHIYIKNNLLIFLLEEDKTQRSRKTDCTTRDNYVLLQ